MKSTLEILKEARALISEEDKWERFAAARDAEGNICSFDSDKAASFCSMGAVWRAWGGSIVGDNTEREAILELNVSSQLLGCKSVVGLNASADHATVLQMFDMAIARLEPQCENSSEG